MEQISSLTQSQPLQRTSEQLGIKASVQEHEKEISESEVVNGKPNTLAVDRERLREITESMNEFLKPVHTALRFQFHDKLEEYFVTLVDRDTDEVLREIPPKKMLDLYASMAESLGFIVDHKI